MIENEHRRTWGVNEETRRADVLTELRRLKKAGTRMTVIQCGHGIYSQARKAFGSWEAALNELDGSGRPANAPDAHASMKHVDVVSPYPCKGLPDFMRQRQIIGGMMLELVAERMNTISDTSLGEELEEALYLALKDWENLNA